MTNLTKQSKNVVNFYNGRGTAEQWIKEGKMKGFNVGMNISECAGQTIMWPHIHFIPRHEGDAPKKGGMRYAHPGADHKEHY